MTSANWQCVHGLTAFNSSDCVLSDDTDMTVRVLLPFTLCMERQTDRQRQTETEIERQTETETDRQRDMSVCVRACVRACVCTRMSMYVCMYVGGWAYGCVCVGDHACARYVCACVRAQ